MGIIRRMMDVLAVPDARLGASDVTRRWGMRRADGRIGWPGITAVEGDRAARGCDRCASSAFDNALVCIELGVVLSDGAGPYLVDVDGTLVLVLAQHPALSACHLAMSQYDDGHFRVGVVRDCAMNGWWRWEGFRDISADDQIVALDACHDLVTHQELITRAESPGSDVG